MLILMTIIPALLFSLRASTTSVECRWWGWKCHDIAQFCALSLVGLCFLPTSTKAFSCWRGRKVFKIQQHKKERKSPLLEFIYSAEMFRKHNKTMCAPDFSITQAFFAPFRLIFHAFHPLRGCRKFSTKSWTQAKGAEHVCLFSEA